MEPSSNTAHALRNRANRAANGDMSDADFRSQFAAILASAAPRTVRDHAFLFLPASNPPWLDTGIELDPGPALA